MPSSREGTLNELDSRLRELKREDGHVFMLQGFRRQFLDAAEQERRQTVRRFGPSSSYDARAGLA
jgi:hypothetical protein